MKSAIIIHGMPDKSAFFDLKEPSPSNRHWFAWLQKRLLINGILTQTPEMPDPCTPDYEKWKKVFDQFKIDENTILIGHSCGGGFIVKWLSENNIKVDKVYLVAPWINTKREFDVPMFDNLQIDESLTTKTKSLNIFCSTNDFDYINNSVDILKSKIKNITIREFKDYGHFTFDDMKTVEFPELLEEILK